MSLVSLLIAVVVICVLIWAVRALTAAFSIGEPVRTLIYVAVVIVVLFWVLGLFGHGPGYSLH